MSTKTLAQLNEAIDQTTDTANKHLDDLPPQVRGGWATAITEAKAKLKTLKLEYRDSLLRNGIAILMKGDPNKIQEFSNFVYGEGEGLVVDASALYKRLADEIEPTLSDSRQWGVGQTQKLHMSLQEVMHELGLVELPMPDRNSMPVVRTYEDVVGHVRDIVRSACGEFLNKLYLEAQAVKSALRIRYTNTLTPVLITNARDDEAGELAKSFAKGSAEIMVTKEDDVDKDFVYKVFKQVNSVINKENKPTTTKASRKLEQTKEKDDE